MEALELESLDKKGLEVIKQSNATVQSWCTNRFLSGKPVSTIVGCGTSMPHSLAALGPTQSRMRETWPLWVTSVVGELRYSRGAIEQLGKDFETDFFQQWLQYVTAQAKNGSLKEVKGKDEEERAVLSQALGCPGEADRRRLSSQNGGANMLPN